MRGQGTGVGEKGWGREIKRSVYTWGPGPPRSNFFFLVILYFIFVVGSPFSPINIAILTQIATIKPKNLTKTIKIFTMVIVIKNIYVYIYIYHQRTKKSCVIGEVKVKFFAIIVNWYKYQLAVASY